MDVLRGQRRHLLLGLALHEAMTMPPVEPRESRHRRSTKGLLRMHGELPPYRRVEFILRRQSGANEWPGSGPDKSETAMLELIWATVPQWRRLEESRSDQWRARRFGFIVVAFRLSS